MKDTAAVREMYQGWLDEIADLEPQLERIRTRLDQLRTLTTTLAQLEEMQEVVGDKGEPVKSHALETTGRPMLDDSGETASGQVQGQGQVDVYQIDIRDSRHERGLSTSEAIIAVLRDARRPMGPREVLDEMIRRGIDPSESSDSLKLVNTQLGRMRANDTQPVRRAGRGRYVFDPKAGLRAPQ